MLTRPQIAPTSHPRPARRRCAARAAAAALAPGLTLGFLLAGPAAPASAHGAPTFPRSRASACGPEGGALARSAVCRAARAANGTADFSYWDELRVPGVKGRDRQLIPDGKLCSGGRPDFRGLDLPRSDWPTTTLVAGATVTMVYRATIPHAGEFRLFVTKDGYRPTSPLRWSDLEPTPFLRVTDPPLVNGSYRLRGTLPRGKVGHHLVYTIWQNAAVDTYYSCSDVVFRASPARPTSDSSAPASTPDPATSDPATPDPATSDPATSDPATPGPATPGPATPDPTQPVASVSGRPGQAWLLTAAAALIGGVALLATAPTIVRRLRVRALRRRYARGH